jgi:hypothetical protein
LIGLIVSNYGGHTSFENRYDFRFRISPNENVLNPFLKNFAKAAANMPELRRAVLWSPIRFDIDGGVPDERELFDYFKLPNITYQIRDHLALGLAYDKPGIGQAFAKGPGDAKCKAHQIWWKVGKWRPNPVLHSLFQQISRKSMVKH